MGWDAKGNGVCDSCGHVGPGNMHRATAVEVLRVLGWHHSKGVTIGGDRYEGILCPLCARNERRKIKTKKEAPQQDAFPLDWEQFRVQEQGEGFQSR